jgi:hypothetical protein
MKTEIRNPKSEIAGIMLFECLVYISVLMILLGLGFGAFYSCWDKSKSLRYHADGITAALHAGERWRADIRSASGPIVARNTDDGQMVEIPRGTNTVFYQFAAGQVLRRLANAPQWSTILPKVKASQMQVEQRQHVRAWRWELELIPTRPQVRVPPVFSFEAVPSVAP